MNVGIVTTWFERGAAYVSRQYRDVLEPHHRVFIYARGGEDRAVGNPEWDGERVHWARRPVMPEFSAVDLADFAYWVRHNRIQLVLFNEQRWWEPILLCDELNVVSGAYVDYYTAETVPLFDAYDFLVCNTRRHHSVFPNHPQAFYVPWGTDVDVFRMQNPDPVEPGSVIFFHSAGMNPYRKGTDLAIRAFEKVRGPARLLIHVQENWESMLAAAGEAVRAIESRLTIVRKTVAAPGLYHLGDVYVYPSRLDGIGLSVAEAIACGLPAIVSDNAPMNEFIDASSGAGVAVERFFPREDGYYWPQCEVSVDALAAAMQQYVDEPIGDRKRAARRAAEANLDWRKNAAPLPGLFDGARKLDTPAKAAGRAAARKFEERRARSSVRHWMSYHFPGVVSAARQAASPVLARLRGY